MPLRPQTDAPMPEHGACLRRRGPSLSPQGEVGDGWVSHGWDTHQREAPCGGRPLGRDREPYGQVSGCSSGLFHGWDGARP
jgi:hypothetical protein